MRVSPWNDTMQRAITEAQARIRAVYPEATFRLVEGEDPDGLYLDAYTEAEDAFAVLDLVSDWLVDLSVNEDVHLHVIPLPKEAAGLPPSAGLSDPPPASRPVLPGRGADAGLQDQALALHQRRDGRGLLAGEVGQETRPGERHRGLAGFGCKRGVLGQREVTPALNYGVKIAGAPRPSRRHAAGRWAHAGGIFSPPHKGLPRGDSAWKRLIQ